MLPWPLAPRAARERTESNTSISNWNILFIYYVIHWLLNNAEYEFPSVPILSSGAALIYMDGKNYDECALKELFLTTTLNY